MTQIAAIVFTPGTDDVCFDVRNRKELAAAIKAVDPAHHKAFVITLHRATGKTTYIFNYREGAREGREKTEDHLTRVAKLAMKIPQECFQ